MMPLVSLAHDHVKLETPDMTALAVPEAHKFALGATKLGVPFAAPQAPSTGVIAAASTRPVTTSDKERAAAGYPVFLRMRMV